MTYTYRGPMSSGSAPYGTGYGGAPDTRYTAGAVGSSSMAGMACCHESARSTPSSTLLPYNPERRACHAELGGVHAGAGRGRGRCGGGVDGGGRPASGTYLPTTSVYMPRAVGVSAVCGM